MLVEFKVRNFRSFKDEAVLSMVADETGDHRDDLPENYIETGHPIVPRLLKVACIFGANASGKTSIFAAIAMFIKFNRYKDTLITKNSLLNANVYALNKNEPIYFELTAFPESGMKVLYCYSFGVINIGEDWLLSSEKLLSITKDGDEELIYFRYWENESKKFLYEFGQNLPKEKVSILLDPNIMGDRRTILLSVAALIKLENCNDFYTYATNHLDSFIAQDDIVVMHPELKLTELSNIIANIDTGITEIINDSNSAGSKNTSSTDRNVMNYFGKHVTDENNIFYVNLLNESSGTKVFINALSRCYQKLKHGGLIAFDELETSLHIHLLKHLIEMFQTEKNTKAQLIFTTHQGQLLDAKLFRDDQIWFTQKDNQQSKLYSLNDYDIPPGTSREKAYYHGAYGAIPKIINDPSLP